MGKRWQGRKQLKNGVPLILLLKPSIGVAGEPNQYFSDLCESLSLFIRFLPLPSPSQIFALIVSPQIFSAG